MPTKNINMTSAMLAYMDEDELLAYLVEHVLELSEIALKAGQPQTSAQPC